MTIPAAGAKAILAIGISAQPTPELPTFTEITKQAGIAFKHSYGDHHLDNIVGHRRRRVLFRLQRRRPDGPLLRDRRLDEQRIEQRGR
jgi:hypothetical protein